MTHPTIHHRALTLDFLHFANKMPADSSSPDVFAFGTKQLLSQLTDETDDETSTNIIRYALLAVGTSSERLQSLVLHICNLPTASGDHLAALLVKLLKLVPNNISIKPKQNGKTLRCAKLVRYYVLSELQQGLEDTTASDVWPAKSIEILAELYQTKELSTTDRYVEFTLERMSTHQQLFVRHNFELFLKMCFTCGPKLDKNTKTDELTDYINKVSDRASYESMTYKFMIAGLIATRDNNWVIVSMSSPTPRVLTPEEESEAEVKL